MNWNSQDTKGALSLAFVVAVVGYMNSEAVRDAVNSAVMHTIDEMSQPGFMGDLGRTLDTD